MATVLLGITGSIAAYKTPELIRLLKKTYFKNTKNTKKTKSSDTTKHSIHVHPIVTNNAKHFVTPLTLATVSECDVSTENKQDFYSESHLELARSADILVIAPATANFIAKAAHGIADDLLTTVFLAYQGPKLIVPAMHEEMIDNPITQENIQKLKSHNVSFLGPISGDLACGDKGRGRMVDPEIIALNIESILLNQQNKTDLSNKKILITSGGTREKIDPVRMITNRSTGKLGTRLAHQAAFLGADVTLISTVPVTNNPAIKKVIQVGSVSEMKAALDAEVEKNDALFMAAAVSDYTVQESHTKRRRQDSVSLELTPTPDLLASVGKNKESKESQQTESSETTKKRIYVGFSLVDKYEEASAREKCTKKHVDYLIVNTPEAIGNDTRTVTIVSKEKSIATELKKDLSVSELSQELLSLI